MLDKEVWGEGCDDTQHFDCGGLIRYVVEKVCGGSVRGISQMTKDNRPQNKFHRPMGRLVQEGEELLPADILVYGKHHIAFAAGDLPGPA